MKIKGNFSKGRKKIGNQTLILNHIMFQKNEMSMYNDTPTGMINSHMRITCVSSNLPCKLNNLNT